MYSRISYATERNFLKLNKNLDSHLFVSRANKLDSKKTIIPTEYYSNRTNTKTIAEIVNILKGIDINLAVDNLIISYLNRKNLIYFKNGHIRTKYFHVRNFVKTLKYNENLSKIPIPLDERDPIGIIYQQIITEGEKNKNGSYYTPQPIVKKLLDINCSSNDTFCDPCCGTGGFLLEALYKFKPQNIYGFDTDEIAVKIAKANLFAQYPHVNFNKNIKCCNFLTSCNDCFDFIITNPPWGSTYNVEDIPIFSLINSNESFSFFIEKSLNSLTKKGIINFLLPISILNVKVHADIRSLIINNFKIEEICTFGKCFKGVLTDVVSLKISKKYDAGNYKFKVTSFNNNQFESSIDFARNNKNYTIPLLDVIDGSIIKKIYKRSKINLKDAKFALGIVTGNNKEQLKKNNSNNLRPIITGKEINKYYLSKSKNFIKYERNKFQQVCEDSYFQEASKFLYKFISKKLVFALDENKNLALNSANIMVMPPIFKLNKYVVLALLNSDVVNYFFIKTINQVKVLKNDIQNLPLPVFNNSLQNKITELVKDLIAKESNNYDSVEELILSYYNFTTKEKQRIKEVVYGRIK